MSELFECHKKLKNGVGKCSVPMWSTGGPEGFCDEPAFGNRLPTKILHGWDGIDRADDGKYAGHVPALACPNHGGPGQPFLDFVFDEFPNPDGPKLIEAENACGGSINAGEWLKRKDGYVVLRVKLKL